MSEPYCYWCAAGICSGNCGTATRDELIDRQRQYEGCLRTKAPAQVPASGCWSFTNRIVHALRRHSHSEGK